MKNPIKSPKQRRSQELVDTILTASTRVFTKLGFDEANTNKIAHTAGVSIGSLYQYFSGKDSIASTIIDRESSRLIENLEVNIDALQNKTPDVIIDHLVQNIFEIHRKNPALMKLMSEQIFRQGKIDEVIRRRRQVIDMLHKVMTKHLGHIRIDPEKLKIASYVIVNGVEGVLTAIDFDPDITDEGRQQMANETATMVKRYLI